MDHRSSKDCQSENPSNKPEKEQTAVKSVDTEVKHKDCQSENPSNKPEKEQTAVKSVDTEVKNKDCQSENPSNKPSSAFSDSNELISAFKVFGAASESLNSLHASISFNRSLIILFSFV
jgi:hypothetical protein